MFFWIVQLILFFSWFVFNVFLCKNAYRLKTDTPRLLRNPLTELLLYLISFVLPLIAGILMYIYHNILWAALDVGFYIVVWKLNTKRYYNKTFQEYKRLYVYDLKQKGILDQFTEQEISETIHRILREDEPYIRV